MGVKVTQVTGKVDKKIVAANKEKTKRITWNKIKKQRVLIAMSLPFVIWVIIFKYLIENLWLVEISKNKIMNYK